MSRTDRAAPLLILTTGGTVGMVRAGHGSGADLAAGADPVGEVVGRLAPGRPVMVEAVCARPSVNIGLDDLAALVRRLRQAEADGVAGVVVTHGTDTLEESAFALDLLVSGPLTVVLTGALRAADAPGADGPANIAAAVAVALDPGCRGAGVLVVLNDEIHAAADVRKAHAFSPSAFASSGGGPLGLVVEGRPRLRVRPARQLPPLTLGRRRPHVPILSPAADTPPAWLRAAGATDGVVVDLPGGGHAPEHLVPALTALAQERPVVFASRTGAGATLAASYGYPGAEMDLLRRGLLAAGELDARKARVALALLLSAGRDRRAIEDWFNPEGRGGEGEG